MMMTRKFLKEQVNQYMVYFHTWTPQNRIEYKRAQSQKGNAFEGIVIFVE